MEVRKIDVVKFDESFDYIGLMSHAPMRITRCPLHQLSDALGLLLDDIPPSQRRATAGHLLNAEDPDDLPNEALFVALLGDNVYGAAWGQRQSGNFAVLWPPHFADAYNEPTAMRLAEHVVRELDETAVEMTQVLLSREQADSIGVLKRVGFRRIAELLYLTCEAKRFPRAADTKARLEFLPYDASLRPRLMRLIEETYEQTLDCTALEGVRRVNNVVNGYQATGVFRPENWLIVRADEEDVGVLLLADHPQAAHWELMYMGLVPKVRGRSWGQLITRHAQWMAGRIGVERIVLAVDAANEPALAMYRRTGFEMWDRRTVYVRFPGGGPPPFTSRC